LAQQQIAERKTKAAISVTRKGRDAEIMTDGGADDGKSNHGNRNADEAACDLEFHKHNAASATVNNAWLCTTTAVSRPGHIGAPNRKIAPRIVRQPSG